MRLGLYRDLAVGVDPGGSAAWSSTGALATGATVGAPPDLFNPLGQDWGLAPFSPAALEASGFAPWIADIRANMRHAGALRVDHVLGLQRLYWVPAGAGPADGAYVRYPFATMAAILALESHRHRCLLVGEDLGTVPPGFRPAMERAGIMGCRVLYFEQGKDGLPTPVGDYQRLAAASVGTHDLAPLRGWMDGTDLGWRERLGLFPTPADAAEARAGRAGDRDRLLAALRAAGLLGAEEDDREDPEVVAIAVHRWLARTPSALLLVQLEDLALQAEAVNLPGTLDEHPNWRRRLGGIALEDLLEAPFARRLLAALGEERPRG
jgi:4-alpha-glucanotransferase